MSSSRPSATLIFEPLPCPTCGAVALHTVVANCHLADGTTVARLRHQRCAECGEPLFDDDAMHRIQHARARQGKSAETVAAAGT